MRHIPSLPTLVAALLWSFGAGRAAHGHGVEHAIAGSTAVVEWHAIAREAIARARPGQHGALRVLTYLSLAQARALSAQGMADEQALRSTVAQSSAHVIAALLPSEAQWVGRAAGGLGSARAEGGAGREAAVSILSAAREDGYANAWRGTTPQARFAWHSLATPPLPPILPSLGTMRTFLIGSGADFRANPPPQPGTPRFSAALEEVRRYTSRPTPEMLRIARFYDMNTGGLVAGFWNETASGFIVASNLSELEAARVLAAMHMAAMDAVIACHDSKYAYWVPRPSQADSSIRPVTGVPNHPSYPSNHSCVSTAAALTLAHFFPGQRARLEALAGEAGMSRVYAGLHYRFDVEAGEAIGRTVAAAARERWSGRLSRWCAPSLSLSSVR